MKILALSPLKNDPSRTVTLRRTFWAALRRRYAKVKQAVKQEVVDNDALGIGFNAPVTGEMAGLVSNQEFWAYLDTPEKIDAFMLWINSVVEREVMTVDWHKGFIESSYRKGLTRAFNDTRKKARAAQSEDFYEGTKKEFMDQAFSQPQTLETVAVVFGQSFQALKGINAAMATSIRSALAESLARGDSIPATARVIMDSIDIISARRARLIAQTEVTRAHAEGQLDAFEKLGVEELGALIEWSTAGDGRVCPKCNSMNGKRYTPQEARGLIPLHPGCRCAWIPYVDIGDE
jgi:SPP1 gp7 family putative phage head morphogenesis protein